MGSVSVVLLSAFKRHTYIFKKKTTFSRKIKIYIFTLVNKFFPPLSFLKIRLITGESEFSQSRNVLINQTYKHTHTPRNFIDFLFFFFSRKKISKMCSKKSSSNTKRRRDYT